MEIKHQLAVNASPDKVWALISDPKNAPRFNKMVQEISDVQEQPNGVGTRWKAIAQMGSRMEIANEITEWDPPRRLAIAMNGPASGTLTFTLSPQGEGSTLVEEQATSDLPAITAPLVQPMLDKSIQESLQNIKEQTEQG